MKFIIAIPALEKNRYSKKGDLVNWGSSSLLEGKFHKLKSKDVKDFRNFIK